MNLLFQNAIRRNSQKIPPIWFMRQAGRYHSHYQGLRQQYTFEQLCRQPELAAQVALGPIMDFDYDVSILFSDILFPLDGLGFELSYSDAGPKLQKSIKTGYRYSSLQAAEALAQLAFQAEALKITREVLPKDKSLIGFVGGLWTLFVYACEGGHAGAMTFAKNEFIQSEDLVHTLAQVICGNIEMQLKAGAEVVMIFDTAAGEVSYQFFQKHLAPILMKWAHQFPNRLGYYSKGTQNSFFTEDFLAAPWAGRGIDHRWNMSAQLTETNAQKRQGFLQGNFDQALLFQDTPEFLKSLNEYLKPYQDLSLEQRRGWVCGLGHGVLPKTPEAHVKLFIQTVRKAFA